MPVQLSPLAFDSKYTAAKLKPLAPGPFSHLKKIHKQLLEELTRFERLVGTYIPSNTGFKHTGLGALNDIEYAANEVVKTTREITNDKSKDKEKHTALMAFCNGLRNASLTLLAEVEKQRALFNAKIKGKEAEERQLEAQYDIVRKKIQQREFYNKTATQYLKEFLNFVATYGKVALTPQNHAALVKKAGAEYDDIKKRCTAFDLSPEAQASRADAAIEKAFVQSLDEKRLTPLLSRNAEIQSQITDLAKEIKIQRIKCETILRQFAVEQKRLAVEAESTENAGNVDYARGQFTNEAREALKQLITSLKEHERRIIYQIQGTIKTLHEIAVDDPAYKKTLMTAANAVKEVELKLAVMQKEVDDTLEYAKALDKMAKQAQKEGNTARAKECMDLKKAIEEYKTATTKPAQNHDKLKRLVMQRLKIQKQTEK